MQYKALTLMQYLLSLLDQPTLQVSIRRETSVIVERPPPRPLNHPSRLRDRVLDLAAARALDGVLAKGRITAGRA